MLHAVMAGEDPDCALNVEQQQCIEAAQEYERLHFSECDTIMRETPLTLYDDDFGIITRGTADLIGLKGGMVKVLDDKFGRKYVPANSLQLKAYAVAAMVTYGKDCAECHIMQPRAGGGRSIMYTDRDALFAQVKAVIDRARRPDAPFCPGEHCVGLYCPIRHTCTAREAWEAAVAGWDEAARVALATRNEAWLSDPAKVGEAARIFKAIEKRGKEIMAYCREMTEAGMNTGFKMVEKRGARAITSPQAALDRLGAHVSLAEYMGLVSIPFGALSELCVPRIREAECLKSAKAAQERFVELLGDVVKEGAPTKMLVQNKE